MFLCGFIFVSVQYTITGKVKEGDFLLTILKVSCENKYLPLPRLPLALLILLNCKSTRRKRGKKECDGICVNILNVQNCMDVKPSN